MRFTLLMLMLLTLLATAGCRDEAPKATETAAPKAAALAAKGFTASVAEVVQTDSYTYARLEENGRSHWCATTRMQLKAGDSVMVPPGSMVRTDYRSVALNRTFDRLLFVDALLVAGQLLPAGSMPPGHPPVGGDKMAAMGNHPAPVTVPAEIPAIDKVEGGYRVAEIFARKAELAGQQVTVRGLAVKVSTGIMGLNWVHLQDGSGDDAAGTYDLTATTDATIEPGTVVTLSGKLEVDQNLGHGYRYPVLLRQALPTPGA